MGQAEPTFRSCDKCLGEGIIPMKDDYGWWVCGCGANLVPDGRLQDIADAWNEMTEREKGRVLRGGTSRFAAVIESLTDEEAHHRT